MVHAVLQESPRKRATDTRSSTTALLKGLIFGPTFAMSPTHTRKGGRLYRYYVSQAVLDVAQLFTEDEGPSMSGIRTVTYPELMSKASQMIPQLAELGATGAGFYYVDVSRRADRSNEDFTKSNALLSVMMYTAVRQNAAMTKRFSNISVGISKARGCRTGLPPVVSPCQSYSVRPQ